MWFGEPHSFPGRRSPTRLSASGQQSYEASVAYRGEEGDLGCSIPLPPEIPKALQNRAKLNPIVKTVKIADFRTPTLHDVRKKGSEILKLPSVRSCFTLAMTNKLVFIINSLKVPKIKNVLLYEMKFLVPNYSCLQNPWLGGRGLPPPHPRSLSLTEFVGTPRTKFLGTPLRRVMV